MSRLKLTKKQFTILLGFFISLLATYFLVQNLKLEELKSGWENTDWNLILFALLLFCVNLLLRSFRFLAIGDINPNQIITMGQVYFSAVGLNQVGMRAGDIVRLFLLKSKLGLSMSRSIAYSVVERVFDMAIIILFLLSSITLFSEVRNQQEIITGTLIFSFVFITILVAVTLFRKHLYFFHRLLLKAIMRKRHRYYRKCNKILVDMFQSLKTIDSIRQFLFVLISSLSIWLIEVCTYFLILNAAGVNLKLHEGPYVVAATAAAVMVPSAPAGLGVYEAMLAGTLNLIDKSGPIEYAAILTHAFILSVTLGATAFGFLTLGLNFKNIFNLKKEDLG